VFRKTTAGGEKEKKMEVEHFGSRRFEGRLSCLSTAYRASTTPESLSQLIEKVILENQYGHNVNTVNEIVSNIQEHSVQSTNRK